MPRNSKDSLIQKIARQAYVTFKNFNASAIGDNKMLLDGQGNLVSLLTEIRAADLNIAPRQSTDSKPDQIGRAHV